MLSYVNSLLTTEITCIPRLFSTYLGDYYNNALCNGATWIFMLWCILHSVFDISADVFMKKLKYREFVRTRLKSCLWYLGFYGTAVVYCGATLTQNEVELFNFKKMHVPSSSPLPIQVILGYTLIVTFYLHSSLWEGLSKGYTINMFHYLFLFVFMVSSYILRIVEISFTLTALISVVQVSLEFTRCCFMSLSQESLLSKIFIGFCYIGTFLIYLTVYLIVIPLTFLLPLGMNVMTAYPNILLILLYLNLLFWFLTEIYYSIAFKLAKHWLYHKQIYTKQEVSEQSAILDSTDALSWCSSTLLECSLFRPRDDESYNFMIIREEIKARKNKMLSMRKPKNMFLQTLKCMVAIKRKLSERRVSEGSDSDDSEKSENDNLKNNDNTDDEIELHSDDESDNEDSDSPEYNDIDIQEQKNEFVSHADSSVERNIGKEVFCENEYKPKQIVENVDKSGHLFNKNNSDYDKIDKGQFLNIINDENVGQDSEQCSTKINISKEELKTNYQVVTNLGSVHNEIKREADSVDTHSEKNINSENCVTFVATNTDLEQVLSEMNNPEVKIREIDDNVNTGTEIIHDKIENAQTKIKNYDFSKKGHFESYNDASIICNTKNNDAESDKCIEEVICKIGKHKNKDEIENNEKLNIKENQDVDNICTTVTSKIGFPNTGLDKKEV